jgi:hypothetical protein
MTGLEKQMCKKQKASECGSIKYSNPQLSGKLSHCVGFIFWIAELTFVEKAGLTLSSKRRVSLNAEFSVISFNRF